MLPATQMMAARVARSGIGLWFQRRRALRGVGPLHESSAEGARVYVSGIARCMDAEEFVAPVRGKRVVVAWMKYTVTSPTPTKPSSPSKQQPLTFERWHLRPFAVETPQETIIVDSGHVRLLVPTYREGGVEETVAYDGEPITVIGSVLRDGIELIAGELSFREAKVSCRLVGNKLHPVVITRAG